MGLKDQFGSDFETVFANTGNREFEKKMTFEIKDDHRSMQFTTTIVWDTETLKNRMVVQQQGVYLGSVLLFIAKRCFKVEPKPDEVLYEIRKSAKGNQLKIGWRVLDVVDAEDVYEISLDRLEV